jgi:hypothetical protein
MATSLVLSTLLGLALAQQTTLNLPFLGYDGVGFVASVVSAKPDATVFALNCPPHSGDCGLFPYHTLTYGPSTYKMDMSAPGEGFTMTQDCMLASSSAVCKESASGSEANFPGSSTETYEGTDMGNAAVTVTTGSDKLAAAAKVTPTGGGSGSPSATAGSAAKSTGASITSSAPASAAAATTSPTGNAAAHAVATNGRLVAAAGLLAGLLL